MFLEATEKNEFFQRLVNSLHRENHPLVSEIFQHYSSPMNPTPENPPQWLKFTAVATQPGIPCSPNLPAQPRGAVEGLTGHSIVSAKNKDFCRGWFCFVKVKLEWNRLTMLHDAGIIMEVDGTARQDDPFAAQTGDC